MNKKHNWETQVISSCFFLFQTITLLSEKKRQNSKIKTIIKRELLSTTLSLEKKDHY